jgi:hypothetical protein
MTMSLEQERMQILKMLEAGTITAEEAAKLLAALSSGAEKEAGPEPGPASKKKRRVRISVSDGPGGRQKEVNITLPLGLAKIMGKMRGKFPTIDGFDPNDIFDAFDSSLEGEIVEIQDEEEGKRVRISIE